MACIRSGHETKRLCDILNDRVSKGLGLNTGIIIGIDTGVQCTFSGKGKIYEDFKAMKKIENYTGFGSVPKTFYDAGFDDATL